MSATAVEKTTRTNCDRLSDAPKRWNCSAVADGVCMGRSTL